MLSEAFKITTGVVQWDVLAPFLFIIVIDYISKQLEEDFGYVTHKGRAQKQIDAYKENAAKVGLRLNIKRTE